ncbi:protein kintoun [Carpediemonas membranifera]|uniref:Protein kintoun n=1 Tax=Carpediemonas membranifera TaxID=201153 RepID=A0A8J6DZV2_9EUKA|nr:protein kintoun [Carpediemonas membranifera]|eukprot:KAG9391253.1 protein kintoun [Carpediemonas membranifera]
MSGEKEDFKISQKEANRIKECFKDPKFVELFADYAKQISDPENFLKYSEEIRKLEEQNRNDPKIWQQEVAEFTQSATQQKPSKAAARPVQRKPAQPKQQPKKVAKHQPTKPVQAPSPGKPMIQVTASRPASKTEPEIPEYSVAYKEALNWSDHFSVQFKVKSGTPDAIRLTVALPAQPRIEDIDLDVEPQWVELVVPGQYHLELPLAFPVDAEAVSADYRGGRLVLEMPVVK